MSELPSTHFRLTTDQPVVMVGWKRNIESWLDPRTRAEFAPEYISLSQALKKHTRDMAMYPFVHTFIHLLEAYKGDTTTQPRTGFAEGTTALFTVARYTAPTRHGVREFIRKYEPRLNVGDLAEGPVGMIKNGRDIDLVTVHRNLRQLAGYLVLALPTCFPSKTLSYTTDGNEVQASWEVYSPDEYTGAGLFQVNLTSGEYPGAQVPFIHFDIMNCANRDDVLRLQIANGENQGVANRYYSNSWDRHESLVTVADAPQLPVDHALRDEHGDLRKGTIVEKQGRNIEFVAEYPTLYAKPWQEEIWAHLSYSAIATLGDPQRLVHKLELAKQPDELMGALGRMIRKGVEREPQLCMSRKGRKVLRDLNMGKNLAPAIDKPTKCFFRQQIARLSKKHGDGTAFEQYVEKNNVTGYSLDSIATDLMAAQAQNPGRYFRYLLDTGMYKMIPALRDQPKAVLRAVYDEVSQADTYAGAFADIVSDERSWHDGETPEFVRAELDYDVVFGLITDQQSEFYQTNQTGGLIFGWIKIANALRRHIPEFTGIGSDAELIALTSRLYLPSINALS